MDFDLTAERIKNLGAHPVDIASAERCDYVAPARARRDPVRGILLCATVMDLDMPGGFALDLEAPADSAKLRQRRRGPLETDSNFHRDRNRRERVQRDVNPRSRNRHRAKPLAFGDHIKAG